MGLLDLFNRKKTEQRVEKLAAQAEVKAAAAKKSVENVVEKFAAAAEEKAAAAKESVEAAVEKLADKVEEAVNGEPEDAMEKIVSAAEAEAGAAADAAEEAVAAVEEAVEVVVPAAVEEAVEEAIPAAVEEVVEEAVPAVEEAAEEAVAAAEAVVEETVAAAEEIVEEAVPAVVEEAVEETVPAAAEEAPAEGAPSCGNPEGDELTMKEIGTIEHVRMNYHAGYGVYNEWPNGGMTIHAGVGWFHPFGPSEYWGVANLPDNFCEEAKQFPLEKFFTEDWMKQFETDLFCIYRMPDGDIYAWDGIFAVRGLDPHKCIVYNSEYTRQDVLVNVIVGGTGRYEGVRGLMIGTTEGGGKTQVCGKMPDGSPLELPETIMKDLDGYIRFPE